MWMIVWALAGCDDHLFGQETEGTYEPTWQGMLESMDDWGCTGCHSTQQPLLPDAFVDDLDLGEGLYVVPFSPEDSTLWQVLIFADGYVGMPLGAQLPAEDITHVEQWILDGASLN
jgi:hypothetical protein